MDQKIVRRLRLIEYSGTEEFVNKQIENASLKGTKVLRDGAIRSCWLGETNEIMLQEELEQIDKQRDKLGADKNKEILSAIDEFFDGGASLSPHAQLFDDEMSIADKIKEVLA